MIPEGWKSQKLEEVCTDIVDCHHSTPAWTNAGFIVLRTQNIRSGVIDFSSVSFTDESHYHERIKRAVPEEGDIVVTREAPAGEVALIPADMKVCLGQRLVLVKPNHELVSSVYVKFYLMSSLVQKNVFQLQSNGSTVGNVRIPVLKNINLFLPPLEEQRKIAEILSTWDKAIELLEQLIAMKRKLKQGLMQQLLTGKRRFRGFGESERFKTKRLGDITHIDQKSLSSSTEPDYTFTYVSLSDVNDGRILENFQRMRFADSPSRARRLVRENDIIMATVRPNLKAFAMVKSDASKYVVSTGFAVISAKEDYFPDYIFQYLFSLHVEQQMNALVTGSNYPAINSAEVRNLRIECPSLAEQKKIASVLSAADTEISTLEKQLSAYKQQKRGLMQQLLTGKKRVASPPSTVFDSGRPLSNFVERGENLA
jgi:type I restriction enzyme, S subunit